MLSELEATIRILSGPKPLERRAAERARQQSKDARGIGQFDEDFLEPADVAEIVGGSLTIPVDPEDAG